MNTTPAVTVLIPARDEVKDIGRCLDAVLAQDHPHHRLEVVVVDGGSIDGTADAVTRHLAGADLAFRIVDNPTGTTPSNLNAGLAVASGDIVCRVDSRSLIPPDYVRRCVETLREPTVAVVGGRQVSLPPTEDVRGRGIARALNNRFSMGASRYRARGASGPADTVYLGAFRVEQLRDLGGWSLDFPTNQDFELNRRMADLGAIWVASDLEVGYVPRASVRALWRQYRRFGRWKAFYWRRTGERPRPRQLVILALPVAAAGVVLLVGRRSVAAGALAVVGGLAMVDEVGSPDPATVGGRVSVGERLVACAATVAVSGGWWSGAVQGLLGGNHPDGRRV